MDEKGDARPVFFCCGCAVAAAVAVLVGVYVATRYLPEIGLALVGGELADEPLDIPVRTVSAEGAEKLKANVSEHLQAAARGEAEDLVLGPEEFELLAASAFCEGETPEEIDNFHVTAEGDKLRVQFSHELKKGKHLNIDFTGGVRIADGKLSLDFTRCRIGGKEIGREQLQKFSDALVEGFEKNPDAAEGLSAFEKLETSGGKLRIRLRPEAAGKLLKKKTPVPGGVEI